MIPTIGLMIAAYAMTRLLQVPVEHSKIEKKWIALLVMALPALAVLGFSAVSLLLSSLTATNGLSGLK